MAYELNSLLGRLVGFRLYSVQFVMDYVQLHPAASELVGPEIAMLNGFADQRWMVWRPGEEAFEDL
ncbi:hypothetical protein [Streptomyces sp. NPDC004579]|uniref:hypothetical protein n=1 Tax=Streptomyces sp. NPDC004579 TaxID=3154667 RepID=UPI0033ADEC42